MTNKGHPIASVGAWRSASQEARIERAERLHLPSGTTILAARPEPLEWILAGRLPQRLLGVALENQPSAQSAAGQGISREEILELARFATQMIRAAVIEPRIGEGANEIALEEIPLQDRVFIFEWACGEDGRIPAPSPESEAGSRPSNELSIEEGQSIPQNGIERFHQK